jgi:hypothetical protein
MSIRAKEERLVSSILLFHKKTKEIACRHEPMRINGDLVPTLRKQLDSIINQAARISEEK